MRLSGIDNYIVHDQPSVLCVLMFFPINSRYGAPFVTCRDDYAASPPAFNTAHFQNLSLAISAFYCGVAGALLAGYMSFIPARLIR